MVHVDQVDSLPLFNFRLYESCFPPFNSTPKRTSRSFPPSPLLLFSQVGPPSPPKKRKRSSGRSDMFEIHDPEGETSSSSSAIDLSVPQLDFGETIPEEVSRTLLDPFYI